MKKEESLKGERNYKEEKGGKGKRGARIKAMKDN
jgi:hypothetical protein